MAGASGRRRSPHRAVRNSGEDTEGKLRSLHESLRWHRGRGCLKGQTDLGSGEKLDTLGFSEAAPSPHLLLQELCRDVLIFHLPLFSCCLTASGARTVGTQLMIMEINIRNFLGILNFLPSISEISGHRSNTSGTENKTKQPPSPTKGNRKNKTKPTKTSFWEACCPGTQEGINLGFAFWADFQVQDFLSPVCCTGWLYFLGEVFDE